MTDYLEQSGNCCSPVRITHRIVGFKVADQTVSPTSVLSARDSGHTSCQDDSPKSSLAEALRGDVFKPLPALRVRTSGRGHSALKKSLSHADLHGRACAGTILRAAGLTRGSEPSSPSSSRASASSTPVRIPSALTRVQTCPMDLTRWAHPGGDAPATRDSPPATLPTRRSSLPRPAALDDPVDAVVRDLLGDVSALLLTEEGAAPA